jgi:hypothetical protein
VDILVTIDNFSTLMNVIIVDPIHIDMMQQTLTTITHVMMMDIQKKT